MTRSEQLVYELSKNAFLPLWTYPNPQGKDSSKELCDVLVVCQPDIIIISVKDSELKTDGDLEVQRKRWYRYAVEGSIDQIHGAQRRLSTLQDVTTNDGGKPVELGETSQRRIHRVAVAIGSDGKVPLESRDFGKGFVDVFDDAIIFLLLQALDTITDLVEYLSARERLFLEGTSSVVGSETDLLASYLWNNRSFDSLMKQSADVLVISGLWSEFANSEEYSAKTNADVPSYIWDRLITLHGSG